MSAVETAKGSAPDKVRVQIDFHRAQMGLIDELMNVCAFDTRKDLFNSALSFFAWAVREVQKGREIGSVNREEHDIVAVQMPAFTIAGQSRLAASGTESKKARGILRKVV
jgi:hypothetical protein